MSFLTLPPEINSALMFSGAGSAPILEAAAAWDGLASELGSAADSFGSVTAGLAGQAWQGPASAAMMAAAAPYSGWLSAAAAQASRTTAQAKAVASTFESALAATVHPTAVAANRFGLMQLVTSNLLGQNAPAIAAAESLYEEMWAQDVSAMVGYHGGASAAVAQLASWQQAVQSLPSQVSQVTGINLGFGNIGSFNLGGGNTGNTNVGSGNTVQRRARG
jgi:PPE-repeat protein